MFTSKIGGTKELDEEIYNQIVQEKLITRASLWGRELKMFVISFLYSLQWNTRNQSFVYKQKGKILP
jgi:hypothetical protein